MAAAAATGYFEYLIAGFVQGATSVPPNFPLAQLAAEMPDVTHVRPRGGRAWIDLPPAPKGPAP